MRTKLVLSLFFLISLKAFPQDGAASTDATLANQEPESVSSTTDSSKLNQPKSRVKGKTNVQPSEASSFIGDSENIDPLNPNRDNIKDDSEPVLEDIKDLSTTATRQKLAEEQEKAAADAAAKAAAQAAEDKRKSDLITGANLFSDNPDLALEKKFHDIYKRYNVNPTPDDVWAAASEKQTSRLYQVQKGDTLWSISKILFGDPNFWPKLWSLNKQGILNPHFINPKMKVYFFEGDEQNSPTISVGELTQFTPQTTPTDTDTKPSQFVEAQLATTVPTTSGGAPILPGEAIAKGPVAGPGVKTNVAENPELAKLTELNQDAAPAIGNDGNIYATKIPFVEPSERKPRSKYKKPIQIPPSFPTALNGSYYDLNKVRKVNTKIDLGRPIKSEFFFNNDIILTDLLVQTDIRLKITEVQKMRCTTGRLLKEIDYSGDLLSEYDIYLRIDDVNTSTGMKYGYRYVGRAKSYQDKYLRVVDCKGIITTDLIILPKDKLQELATQKTSDEAEARIIGGPDVNQQKFFSTLYYGYVDFGIHPYTVGQEYKTVSEVSDKVNGEFKVVEKFGSYGVVIFTNVKEQITIGDRVLVQ